MLPEQFLALTRRSIRIVGVSFENLEQYVPNTTALHIAAIRNNIPVLFFFLKSAHGISRTHLDAETMRQCADTVKTQDAYGHTVMHYMALRNGFEDEAANMRWHMKILYDFGANLSIANNANETVHNVMTTCSLICTTDIKLGGVFFDARSRRVAHVAPTTQQAASCSIL